MAGGTPVPDAQQLGHLGRASVERQGTSSVEAASGWWVERRRQVVTEQNRPARPLPGRVGDGKVLLTLVEGVAVHDSGAL